jgi:hypothetical protein
MREVRPQCYYFGTMLAASSSQGILILAKDSIMAKYGSGSKREVKKAIHKTKKGTQRSGKKGKAKSRKQAIAIGLSKARKRGAKVPPKKTKS